MRSDFVKPLLLWYNTRSRDLPWRKTGDPYRIWVSEIMLQQTRVEAVVRYYERFIGELPDIEKLAQCAEERLLKLWEGLGYYSRVRNMQKAAILICEQYSGRMPDEASELKKLPGIGDYTAGAIASIAYGKAEPAVDGNLIRVLSRIASLKTDFSSQKAKKSLTEMLRSLTVPKDESWGNLNQAFMDLGATVCLPNSAPLCTECPIADYCSAHQTGEELLYPVRPGKKARRELNMTVMLIHSGDYFVIRKRPARGLLANLYEFPNTDGFLNEDETIRYVEKMTGTYALRIRRIREAKHIFSHVEWHMRGYEIYVSSPSETVDLPEVIYADASEIEQKYPIPSAFSAYAGYLNINIGKKTGNAITTEE